ncbi:MAG TPA: FAD/NAD(P)-binding oxidoreductase [Holophagaceae bacterium]|nr:FAD/NAD(P)-binding oxidoreductase [Holophagaceae bacterium]
MPKGLLPRVLVLGAGPAGLAAAIEAAQAGAQVALVDALPEPGGQIWRSQWRKGAKGEAARCFEALRSWPISRMMRTRIISAPSPGLLAAESPTGPLTLAYDRLVLATGARERFLPFPGWTLPGVTGAGALQAMAKSGLDLKNRRVVVSGSGPLLLAVAAHLQRSGARVVAVAEQAPLAQLRPFAKALLSQPSKLLQAAAFIGLPYRTGSWVQRAKGCTRLEGVLLRSGSKQQWIECDFLACGFGLIPSLEAAQMMGCATQEGRVAVDEWQRTSVPGIFAAGESTGVGGEAKALLEGRIAGLSAADRAEQARDLLPGMDAQRRFTDALETAFALRPELRALPEPGTIVCRCEDVPFGALAACARGRDARLHARCGMGLCQGRTCGPAAAYHFGWEPGGPRLPLYPASFPALLQGTEPEV